MASNTEKYQSADSGEELDLGRLFGLMIDNKWLIALIVCVFTFLGILYVTFKTPVYQSDALLEIEGRANPASNPVQNLGVFGDTPRSTAEMQILTSRMVLGQAADRLNLQLSITPDGLPILGDTLARRGIERPSFAQGWSSVWAGESINVTRFVVPDSWINRPLTIKSLGNDRYELRDDGQLVLEGQVGQLAQSRDGNVEMRVMDMTAGQGAEFTVVKRSRLSAINSLRAGFDVEEVGRSGTGILQLTLNGTDRDEIRNSLKAITDIYITQNIERQSAEAQQSLDFLNQQAPRVRDSLVEAENKLNNYRVNQDSVDLDQETSSVLNQIVNLDNQLNQLKFDEADLSRRFNKSHPQYQALLQKREELNAEKERLQKRVDGLPETQQEVLRLQRDVNVNQEMYVQMLNRMQEMNIAKAGAVGNVRIIDDSTLQNSPVAPRKVLVTVIAFVLGLVIAIIVVLIRRIMNRGIESPEQLEQIGMPVYASIPLSGNQSGLVKRTRGNRNLRIGRNQSARNTVDTGVLALRNSDDQAVEAVRSLRTSLHFAMMEAPNARLMISSASPGAGKSFVVSNLGVVCAQAGQRVLVIDADMRMGHLHHVFKGRSEKGLSDILARRTTASEVVRSGGVDGLDFISRGAAPPNPAELLMSAGFSELLAWADQHYDLIIIDTPPILAVTDAAIIGKQAGTNMLLARYGVNPPAEIEQARRRFEHSGVEIKGTVLNGIEQTASHRYGGNYGNYHYSYGKKS
ncbi:polysaccharide biosynthesis tyrosine autokinase [Kushneria phyllosphaerae]|uniref:Tyrosine-protein kinase in cps region n=1 Tax=Kushneria phyllosphaerae TaxID=2100822 RepID=A0A2R8CQ54_9GAMM|nr:polysaccharide biosynthesis tyrosine autokinase [Kushneria phyllosphaerae]SPJ34914.1 Putative tyrosine-protein kinase in cps region [Kushneria phyllosphaerae]